MRVVKEDVKEEMDGQDMQSLQIIINTLTFSLNETERHNVFFQAENWSDVTYVSKGSLWLLY